MVKSRVGGKGKRYRIFPPEEIAMITTAIGNHDEGTGQPVNDVSAALILADKSDVRRSRVRNSDMSTFDIHDRVNYSVTKNNVEKRSSLKIPTDDEKFGGYCFCPLKRDLSL